MRQLIALVCLFVSVHSHIFAQPKIVKRTSESWDTDSSKWNVWSIASFEYDANGRNIYFFEEYNYLNNQTPRFLLIQKEWDGNGNLVEEFRKSNDLFNAYEWKRIYKYNVEGKVIEMKSFSANGPNASLFNNKNFIYKYENGKHSVCRYDWDYLTGTYLLSLRIDTLFNQNGCITEELHFDLENDTANTVLPTLKIKMKRDKECYLLLSERYKKDSTGNSFNPTTRDIYEYTDGYLTRTLERQNYIDSIGWDTYSFEKTTRNSQQQLLYYLSDYMGGRKTVLTFGYDEEGNILFQKYYLNDELISGYSFIYTYDEMGRITRTRRVGKNYITDAESATDDHFTYYCDGQLKTLVEDRLPDIFRTRYEYDYTEECNLEKGIETLNVYPNPSQGKLEIESNLLSGPNAVIRIFSGTGQEVYTETIPDAIERRNVDLTGFPSGSYYLSIQNGKFSASKRILIQE